MIFSTVIASCGLGFITGILYGFLFNKQNPLNLKIQPESTDAQQVEAKKKFLFFLTPALRILLIVPLWYYVLRSSSLNIIMVLLTFLISFWTVILQKKVFNE